MFSKTKEDVARKVDEVSYSIMDDAINEEIAYARENGRTYVENGIEYVIVEVSGDGAWTKKLAAKTGEIFFRLA